MIPPDPAAPPPPSLEGFSRAGEVWLLSIGRSEVVVLLLGGCRQIAGSGTPALRALTLHSTDDVATFPGEVDWWSEAWFQRRRAAGITAERLA